MRTLVTLLALLAAIPARAALAIPASVEGLARSSQVVVRGRVAQVTSRWSDDQLRMHLEAARRVDQVRKHAFEFIGEKIKGGLQVSEYQVQQFILDRFRQSSLVTDHPPIVAVNANASDPHYAPARDRTSSIAHADLVLIDLWAKMDQEYSVYYDITWSGVCSETIPTTIQNVFEIVKNARDKACEFVLDRVRSYRQTFGWEVDDVARNYIRASGHGERFFHRTGHSIGTEVHGNGTNMDNLECHDERIIIPRTCFSIEPGIYLDEFGIRSEVNIYVGIDGARVTGEEQQQLVNI